MSIWIIERKSGKEWQPAEIVKGDERGRRIKTLRESYPLSAFRLAEYRRVPIEHNQD